MAWILSITTNPPSEVDESVDLTHHVASILIEANEDEENKMAASNLLRHLMEDTTQASALVSRMTNEPSPEPTEEHERDEATIESKKPMRVSVEPMTVEQCVLFI